MSFTLTKGYPIHPQCETESTIKGIWMEKDCEVEVKGKKKKSDLVMIKYSTKYGEITQRYFPVMDDDTELGKVVKAINDGEIPDEILDPEEFFVGKKIGIVVKHNKSRTTGRTFANVSEVFSLVEDEDDVDLDLDESTEADMLDEDSEYGDDLDFDVDSNDDDHSDFVDEDDSDLVFDEELEDDDPPKRPKPRRRSTWATGSYDEQPDDFSD